jgi:hypothetical protein
LFCQARLRTVGLTSQEIAALLCFARADFSPLKQLKNVWFVSRGSTSLIGTTPPSNFFRTCVVHLLVVRLMLRTCIAHSCIVCTLCILYYIHRTLKTSRARLNPSGASSSSPTCRPLGIACQVRREAYVCILRVQITCAYYVCLRVPSVTTTA